MVVQENHGHIIEPYFIVKLTMVNHCSITMVKPCLTIVKTNHASPILQKCQNHGKAWFNNCIPCYSMVLQLWLNHGLAWLYTHHFAGAHTCRRLYPTHHTYGRLYPTHHTYGRLYPTHHTVRLYGGFLFLNACTAVSKDNRKWKLAWQSQSGIYITKQCHTQLLVVCL